MEGVMMLAPDQMAIAVRSDDGKIHLRTRARKKAADKYKFLGWPVIRGVVNFGSQMYMGMKTLMESAEMSGMEGEEPSEFEKKAAKFLHMTPDDFMMTSAVVIAVLLTVGLFFVIPTAIESALKKVIESRLLLNLIGGVIRMGMFLGYVALVARLKEIRRVFEYHGAEHKSIFCYEAGEELTVENARKYTTLHPRCGTSFLVFVMTISILMFTLFGADTGNVLIRVGSRLLLLPVVAGLSYELLKWLGRAQDNMLVRVLKWPGLMTQKLTTKEPSDDMLEVALTSLKASLHMELPEGIVLEDESGKTVKTGEKEAEQTGIGE